MSNNKPQAGAGKCACAGEKRIKHSEKAIANSGKKPAPSK